MEERDRLLVVLRHAKSDWPIGVADHSRPLSARGRRDAVAAGRWLAANVRPIDRVWVSSAVRTQQTWGLVSRHLEAQPVAVTSAAIYAAPWVEMLDVVRTAPDDSEVVAIVGHNPGCENLVRVLAGPESDPQSRERMSLKYSTAGIAVLSFTGPWIELRPEAAVLVEFAIPRG